MLWAYDCLKPYAFKADLGRYCLLYALGGWYADITLKPMMSVAVDQDTRLVYFYDHGSGPCHALHGCQNGLLYARRHHPLMMDLIERVVVNCRNKFYGVNPLSPTGPTLLGKLVAKYVPSVFCHYGHFMQLTPWHNRKNRAYVGPEGDIFAYHKTAWNPGSSAGSLDQMGAKGVNDYTKMWFAKEVYR